jgi:hypothetical protein
LNAVVVGWDYRCGVGLGPLAGMALERADGRRRLEKTPAGVR